MRLFEPAPEQYPGQTTMEEMAVQMQEVESWTVVPALRNYRATLIAMHEQLDINSPESTEVARLITEIRCSIETLTAD